MPPTIQQARLLQSIELRGDLSDGPAAQVVIARLAVAALGSSDARSLFDVAADLIAEALDVELVAILRERDPARPLVLEAVRGWSSDVAAHSDCGSLAEYTLVVGEPVLVEDLATEERFAPPSSYLKQGIVSSMSVPIPGEARPYGVLASAQSRFISFRPLRTSSKAHRRTSGLVSRLSATRRRRSAAFSITPRSRSARSRYSRAAVKTVSTTRLSRCSRHRGRVPFLWSETSWIRRQV